MILTISLPNADLKIFFQLNLTTNRNNNIQKVFRRKNKKIFFTNKNINFFCDMINWNFFQRIMHSYLLNLFDT